MKNLVQEQPGEPLAPSGKITSPRFSQRVVGLRLRQARRIAGVSQAFLARKAGVNSSQLSRIEKGRRNISLQAFARLAWALDASADELLFGKRGCAGE